MSASRSSPARTRVPARARPADTALTELMRLVKEAQAAETATAAQTAISRAWFALSDASTALEKQAASERLNAWAQSQGLEVSFQ